MANMQTIVSTSLPAAINELIDSKDMLIKIARYCEQNYAAAPPNDKGAAFIDTQKRTKNALTNVAFCVTTIASQLITFADLQSQEIERISLQFGAVTAKLRSSREMTGAAGLGTVSSTKVYQKRLFDTELMGDDIPVKSRLLHKYQATDRPNLGALAGVGNSLANFQFGAQRPVGGGSVSTTAKAAPPSSRPAATTVPSQSFVAGPSSGSGGGAPPPPPASVAPPPPPPGPAPSSPAPPPPPPSQPVAAPTAPAPPPPPPPQPVVAPTAPAPPPPPPPMVAPSAPAPPPPPPPATASVPPPPPPMNMSAPPPPPPPMGMDMPPPPPPPGGLPPPPPM